MFKFIAGFTTAVLMFKNSQKIFKRLEKLNNKLENAKLEMQQDIPLKINSTDDIA